MSKIPGSFEPNAAIPISRTKGIAVQTIGKPFKVQQWGITWQATVFPDGKCRPVRAERIVRV